MSLLNVPREDVRSPLGALGGVLRRLSPSHDSSLADQPVLWGVPRRNGWSDLDDPRAHAGIPQHAFLLHDENEAICGYRPPRRRNMFSRRVQVELVLPSVDYNPPCLRCLEIAGEPMAPRHAIPVPVESDRATQDAPAPRGSATVAIIADPEPVARPRARERVVRPAVVRPTVRFGGTTGVKAGRDSVSVRVRDLGNGTAVVADVADGPRGVRVMAVTMIGGGRARIVLNRAVDRPTAVNWFVVGSLRPAAQRRRPD